MIIVKAHAKINLTLDVTGMAENGYHTLSMLMQSVSLTDTLNLRSIPRGIRLSSKSTRVPLNENNLVHKAARLFLDKLSIVSGVSIELRKNIPVAAGLGGGSADAAAVLTGLNVLFETGLSQNELCDMGFMLGADVPFCIIGGTALCEGFGETVTPLPSLPDCYFLIAKPLRGMSTSRAFELYNSFGGALPAVNTTGALNAVKSGDFDALCSFIGNKLQPVTESVVTQVRDLTVRMLEDGAVTASMTGSGTAVFGIYQSRMLADKSRRHFPPGTLSYICTPSTVGVAFM